MALADSSETQDESKCAAGYTTLIGMGDDTRIEQRRRFKGVFVQEVGADQLPLRSAKGRMSGKNILHVAGARVETCRQIAMPTLEILQHLGQLAVRCLRVQCQYP